MLGNVSASNVNTSLEDSKLFLVTKPDIKFVDASTSFDMFSCNVLPVVNGISSIWTLAFAKLPWLPCGASISNKSFQFANVEPSL